MESTKDYAEAGSIVEKRYTDRGWTGLGENKDLTPSDVKKIIEMSF